MDNFNLKYDSFLITFSLIWSWKMMTEAKIEDLTKKIPDWILINWKKLKKNTEDYNFLENYRKKKIKRITKSDFPEEIKKKMLKLYKLENISLENYLEFIEILKWEPFCWDEKIFKADYSRLKQNPQEFLNHLWKINKKFTDKMLKVISKEKKENL